MLRIHAGRLRAANVACRGLTPRRWCGHPGPHTAGASLMGRRSDSLNYKTSSGLDITGPESPGRACGFSDRLVADSQCAGDGSVAHP
jgi:hypothetical protein